MSFELHELKWAIVAAKHRSLRQAAETLNVRQSTLSRRLRDLEHRLGATLFQRTNGGTKPTVAGLEFLESAQRLLIETEAITTRLRARSRGECGQLTIGVHTSLTAGNLRATLVDHRQRFPGVETRIVDGSSERLLSDLISSAMDIAFIAEEPIGWDDRSLSVWSERVVVALPIGHPLSDHETVRWAELRNERLLMPQRGPGPQVLKLTLSKMAHAEPCQILRHDADLDRLLTLVGAGWGLLLVLEGATGAVYPGVTFREMNDNGGPTRVNFYACWRDTNSSPSLQPFLDLLRERYPDLSAAPTSP